MNADQVRAIVAANFPSVLNGPLAVACATLTAADVADRAVRFASLQARATDAGAKRLRAGALAHAEACMAACNGWTVETLGHNIESAFGDDMEAAECDEIACKALGL